MSAVASLLWTLVVLLLPGLALGSALRLRGHVLVGSVLPLTLGMTGAAALAFDALEIPWTPVSVAGAVALVVLVTAGASALARAVAGRFAAANGPEPQTADATAAAPPAARRWRDLAPTLAVACMALAGGAVMGYTTRGLGGVSRTWDSIFHAGAIRYISDHENASPWALRGLTWPAAESAYYPDVFHALGALVLRLPGADMPATYNALLVVAALAFPVGIAALARRASTRPWDPAAAALLAVVASTPITTLVGWGTLAPFLLVLAAGPGLLALVDALIRTPTAVAGAATPATAPAGVVLAAGIGVAGLYLTHPGAAAGLLIGAAAVALWAWFGTPRRLLAAVRAALAGLVAAALVAPGLDFGSVHTMATFDWEAVYTRTDATVRILTFGTHAKPQYVLTVFLVLTIPALVVAGRRGAGPPLAVTALLFGWLYVLTASSDAPYVQTITALWWNDRYRLDTLAGTFAIVPMGLALGWATRRAGAVLRHIRADLPRRALSATTALAAVALLATSAVPGITWSRETLGKGQAERDEQAVYAALAERYRGGTVLNNPFDGSPWAYALHGVPVLFGVPLAEDPARQYGTERMHLYAAFDRYPEGDPVVVAAVRDLDVRWVIVGTSLVGDPLSWPPGLARIETNAGVRLVERHGGAALYEVRRELDHLAPR